MICKIEWLFAIEVECNEIKMSRWNLVFEVLIFCVKISGILGKPSRKKSAVFFNIVQTGGGLA